MSVGNWSNRTSFTSVGMTTGQSATGETNRSRLSLIVSQHHWSHSTIPRCSNPAREDAHGQTTRACEEFNRLHDHPPGTKRLASRPNRARLVHTPI